VHCSVENAAVSCVNQRERLTQYGASPSEVRRRLRKTHLARFASSWFGTFAIHSRATGSLFCHETLGNEWYVVIKAYKLTVFDILRDFFVLQYIACPRYPYIRVYRLYDKGQSYVKYIRLSLI